MTLQEADWQRIKSYRETEDGALFVERSCLWDESRALHLDFAACSEDDLGEICDRFARFYKALADHRMRTDRMREERRKLRGY
jgi:hypothetical protein